MMDEKPPPYIAAAREHGIPLRQSAPISRPRGNTNPLPPPPPLELPILNWMRTHRVILASKSPRRRAMLSQVLGPQGARRLEIIPSSKPEDLDKTAFGPHEYVLGTATQKALDVYAAAIAKAAAIAEGRDGEDDATKQQEEDNSDDSEDDDSEDETAAATSDEKKPLNPPKSAPSTPSRPPPPQNPNGDPSREPDLVISADTVIVTRDGRILEKPTSPANHVAMLRHLRDTRMHRVLTAVCAIAPRADASHPGYELQSHVEETRVYFCGQDDGLPDDVIESYVKSREGIDKAGGYAVQGLGGMVLVEKVDGCVDNVVGLPVRKCLQICEKVVFRQGEAAEGSDEEE